MFILLMASLSSTRSQTIKHDFKLVLLRHGQSAWNKTNQFTGWVGVPLTEQGVEEAERGELLGEERTSRYRFRSSSSCH